MEVLEVILIAISAVVMIMIVNNYSKEQALMLRITTCIIIFFLTFSKLGIVGQFLNEFGNLPFESNIYIEIILKIIAIAYLIEIASEISKDAGEGAIASNLMLAGKVLIIYVASPIIKIFITQMTQMIG